MWAENNLSEGFLKYLPVKHVSVKDMLRILKECKNNNQKALLWSILIRLLRLTLQRSTIYAQILWQMIDLIKLHKTAKLHQYTICIFFLTDLQNPTSSRFGPPLGGFLCVTSWIEV